MAKTISVKAAKTVAKEWVMGETGGLPDFLGAFSHGSINWLPDEAALAAGSDVDIMLVCSDPPPLKLGKFVYRGVMLEVSYLADDQVQSAGQVLGRYNLAGSFQGATILYDPSGRLSELQRAVVKDYTKRHWVRRRCEQAREKVLNISPVKRADPLFAQVFNWVFPAGITTHVLLVAGLRNPTVRRRYVAVRELLADYGRLDFHETLLEVLGSAHMSRDEVEKHLVALNTVFDAAAEVPAPPLPFASDISDLARPIAIAGSQAMIEQGFHREAVFWLVVTYARCQAILVHGEAPALQDQFRPGFRELLADLGINDFAGLQARRAQVDRCLPEIWAVAEAIMAANPQIDD